MTSEDLKRWRKKNGYTQNQLAKALSVHTITVNRWENEAREIPSFLHLALRCLVLEGGEEKGKGQKTKMRKEV